MPTYQYRCSDCGTDLEVVQKFTDSALTECPNCGGSLRKVFNAVGVVFKGSGFYRTDSRAADKSGDSAESRSDSKREAKPVGDSTTKAAETKSTNGSGSSESPKPAASSAPAPAKAAPSSSSSTGG